MKRFLAVCLLIPIIALSFTKLSEDFFTPAFYQDFTQVYGQDAKERATDWRRLLGDHLGSEDQKKLAQVNDFFNKSIQYESDDLLWGQEDYWASPVETVGRGKGDCEDFAIAKFFTLVAMGVPEANLRLMYVRQLTVDVPHMVLLYFKDPKAMPLVLDNYDDRIMLANKRPDLKPIYSFNGEGLWLAKSASKGHKVENGQVSAWTQLLLRIERGDMQTFNPAG